MERKRLQPQRGSSLAGEGECENSNGESGTQRIHALQVELITVDYIWEGVINGCEDFYNWLQV